MRRAPSVTAHGGDKKEEKKVRTHRENHEASTERRTDPAAPPSSLTGRENAQLVL